MWRRRRRKRRRRSSLPRISSLPSSFTPTLASTPANTKFAAPTGTKGKKTVINIWADASSKKAKKSPQPHLKTNKELTQNGSPTLSAQPFSPSHFSQSSRPTKATTRTSPLALTDRCSTPSSSPVAVTPSSRTAPTTTFRSKSQL